MSVLVPESEGSQCHRREFVGNSLGTFQSREGGGTIAGHLRRTCEKGKCQIKGLARTACLELRYQRLAILGRRPKAYQGRGGGRTMFGSHNGTKCIYGGASGRMVRWLLIHADQRLWMVRRHRTAMRRESNEKEVGKGYSITLNRMIARLCAWQIKNS